MNIDLHSLNTFTVIYVDRARELARAGHKDEARDWLKFFRNARIYELCARYSGPLPISDLAELRKNLWALEEEYHPASHADNLTDVRVMRSQLDTIAFGIHKVLEKLSPQHP